MPVTLTVAQLADRLRVDNADAEPQLGILAELLQVGKELVEMEAPTAPDAILNTAAARVAGYIYDSPNSSAGAAFAAALYNSGAFALLSRWSGKRSALGNPDDGRRDDDTGAGTDTVPETNLTPSTHPVHPGTHFRFIGWSDDSVVTVEELAAASAFTGDVLTVPARSSDGYLFAAFEADVGVPTSAYRQGNPTNVIAAWRRQSGTLSRGGVDYIILILAAEQSSAIAGITYTFGYRA